MTSENIRGQGIPPNLIIFHLTNSNVNPNFAHETSLYNKFTKGVATACTNPGASVGADAHVDPSVSGSHTHPSSGGGAHSHTVTVGANPAALTTSNPGSPAPILWPNVSHSHTSPATGSGTSISSVAPGSGSHTHPSVSQLPIYRTIRHIKKTTIVSIRGNNVPQNAGVYWPNTLASIPSGWTLNTTFAGGRFPRGISCGGNINTTGGANTHQHGNDGSHSHSASFGPHSHTFGTTGPSGGGGNNSPFNPGGGLAGVNHTHPAGSLTAAGGPFSANTTAISHQPDATAHDPPYHTLAIIERTSINMRNKGLPKSSISEWLDTVASKPTGFQVSDGTNGSPNLLAKYPKEIPCGSTNPGTTGGNNTHQHAAHGSHSHSPVSIPHSHPVTGTLGNSVPSYGVAAPAPSNFEILASHPHPVSTGVSPGTVTVSSNPTTHQHGTTSNDPASVTVAFLYKLP